MRIAIHATEEVGTRAGRIMLAERDLKAMGLFEYEGRKFDDRRIVPATELAHFDVVVSDDLHRPERLAEIAAEASISCVLRADFVPLDDLEARFSGPGTTLLVGANLAQGIAATLAAHELARTNEVLDLTLGWTVEGRPRRRGEAIPFPDPVGARWAQEVEVDDSDGRDSVPVHRFVAPIEGEWAGAMARVTGVDGDGVAQRVVGVADHVNHLEAIALAAGALAVAANGYEPGVRRPEEAPERYLEAALGIGMAVATYTVEESKLSAEG
ncbi:MAG: hypothetical protein ACE5KX_01430 [Acidimicrobiia bacterium]